MWICEHVGLWMSVRELVEFENMWSCGRGGKGAFLPSFGSYGTVDVMGLWLV